MLYSIRGININYFRSFLPSSANSSVVFSFSESVNSDYSIGETCEQIVSSFIPGKWMAWNVQLAEVGLVSFIYFIDQKSSARCDWDKSVILIFKRDGMNICVNIDIWSELWASIFIKLVDSDFSVFLSRENKLSSLIINCSWNNSVIKAINSANKWKIFIFI